MFPGKPQGRAPYPPSLCTSIGLASLTGLVNMKRHKCHVGKVWLQARGCGKRISVEINGERLKGNIYQRDIYRTISKTLMFPCSWLHSKSPQKRRSWVRRSLTTAKQKQRAGHDLRMMREMSHGTQVIPHSDKSFSVCRKSEGFRGTARFTGPAILLKKYL